MKDRLPEIASLSTGEQNAQRFSQEARTMLRESFKDLVVHIDNWSQIKLAGMKGIAKKAEQKGAQEIADAFYSLAKRAQEEGIGLMEVVLIGDNRARIDMALMDLDEIASKNGGSLDKKQGKNIRKNPEREFFESVGIPALPPRLISNTCYLFK